MAALLLQRIGVDAAGGKPMPDNSMCNQMASLPHSKATVYSASQDEEAMVFCLQVFHEMMPDPKVNE